MIIDKYFSSLRNLSCHDVKKFVKTLKSSLNCSILLKSFLIFLEKNGSLYPSLDVGLFPLLAKWTGRTKLSFQALTSGKKKQSINEKDCSLISKLKPEIFSTQKCS